MRFLHVICQVPVSPKYGMMDKAAKDQSMHELLLNLVQEVSCSFHMENYKREFHFKLLNFSIKNN